MIKYENRCYGCSAPGYPCLGSSCPNSHQKCFYCDDCGDEFSELYYYDDEELCFDCIKRRLVIVR